MSNENHHIRTEPKGKCTLVHFLDNRLMDDVTIRDVGKELLALASADEPKLVLVLRNVRFLASAMLGKLITLQRRIQQNNGTMAICDLSEEVHEVFRISRLDGYFQLYRDADAASATLA